MYAFKSFRKTLNDLSIFLKPANHDYIVYQTVVISLQLAAIPHADTVIWLFQIPDQLSPPPISR